MNIFPAHYSETAIAVLSLPGWVDDGLIGSLHEWSHDNGTLALVHADGTISTCRPTYDHDPWSDDGAMAFFDTILDGEAYQRDDGYTFFVTGEQYDNWGLLWTVRKQSVEGSIDTVGDFQKYGTKEEARAAAKEYASA